MGLNLSADNVSKTYNGERALADCSFSFQPGSVSVLMGPNGSGKSTFLRICALLEAPDGGAVVYASGREAVPIDLSLRRRITLVLPRVGVFNATVARNAAYGLRLRGLPKDVIDRKTGEALQAVGLSHKMQQNALTLSSGETQRLGLARAMAIDPEILFLDEPTASIDEVNTRIVEDMIREMRRGGRTTVILSTHDRDQADRLADVVVLMREGKIVGAEAR